MRLLVALAALAVPFASTPAHTPSGGDAKIVPPPQDLRTKPLGGHSDCRRPDVHLADSNKGKFNRLGELPPGQLELTVVREVEGCNEPVIVRYGYGLAAPARESETAPVMPRARRW